jgi:tyrosyl-tRNA synthetase
LVLEGAYAELQRRGFIQQVTESEPLQELMRSQAVSFYVGFDPTAESLHAGNLLPIMGMLNMQRCGHRAIAVIGGGTAMVGDPSGKSEMRKMLTREQIEANAGKIKNQLLRYLGGGEENLIIVDNFDWLGRLNYIDFLRDIGRHFSVNRMLTFETYKMRLETGLSFLEFNYQLLQAFDFLSLFKKHNCRLQMGGDDQWANILAGADLIRRKEGADVYGLTFPLLTTATGAKMGKTESGALWLDPQKVTPYDFYQYWINTDDRDVQKFLSFYTLLPVEEIEQVAVLTGAELNQAKTILAYEATKLSHGEELAKQALHSAVAAFGAKSLPQNLLPSSSIPRGDLGMNETGIPSTSLTMSQLESGIRLSDILATTGLASSRTNARNLIKGGGVYLNGERVDDVEATISRSAIQDGKISLRIGKKKHHNLIVKL